MRSWTSGIATILLYSSTVLAAAAASAFTLTTRLPFLSATTRSAHNGPAASPFDAELCARTRSRLPCPGLVRGGDSTIGDEAANLPPHLLVTFEVEEMSNTIVSDGGVQNPAWVIWEAHSTAANVEAAPGEVGEPVPGPGETWEIPAHASGVYGGIVLNGCGSTPVFPIDFKSSIREEPIMFGALIDIGHFTAVDNSTIQPNGHWIFNYTIHATSVDGGVSDYHFKGIVTAKCTNATAFE